MAASELQEGVSASAAAVAAAEARLAALEDRVFAGAPAASLGRHLSDMRLAVARILGDPAFRASRVSGDRPWSLAALAAEDAFQRNYDAVAMAIADLFTLKVHLDLGQLRASFAVFVESFDRPSATVDYRSFIDMVGRLIASCASRRIVTYNAMVRERTNQVVRIVLDYPGEVTALALGAGLYATQVKRLTGNDPSVPLTAMYLENAAALIRRQPEAAQKFRELLQLTTPWV